MLASVRGRSRMNSSRQMALATRSAQPWSSASSLNRSAISWMSVRFSFDRLPSTSSNTLSSVTSVPMRLLGHGRPVRHQHLVGLLDDRPVAAAVVPGRAGLEPDARHDADAQVDVVRRVRVELDEIALGDLGAAGRPLQPQGGVQRPLVLGEELLQRRLGLRASWPAPAWWRPPGCRRGRGRPGSGSGPAAWPVRPASSRWRRPPRRASPAR